MDHPGADYAGVRCFRPIPDEEGTEMAATPVPTVKGSHSFRPIPDEEGTEISEQAGIGFRAI